MNIDELEPGSIVDTLIAQIMGVSTIDPDATELTVSDAPPYSTDESLVWSMLDKLRTEIDFQDFVIWFPNPRDTKGSYEIEIIPTDEEIRATCNIGGKYRTFNMVVCKVILRANEFKLLNRSSDDDSVSGEE